VNINFGYFIGFGSNILLNVIVTGGLFGGLIEFESKFVTIPKTISWLLFNL
jgi:hypothetical protein